MKLDSEVQKTRARIFELKQKGYTVGDIVKTMRREGYTTSNGSNIKISSVGNHLSAIKRGLFTPSKETSPNIDKIMSTAPQEVGNSNIRFSFTAEALVNLVITSSMPKDAKLALVSRLL